jgi:monofunctional biosynthetic peptidoglycan transglycosylase
MVRSQVLAWWEGRPDYRWQYHWVGLNRISRFAQLAVIASEDQAFATHVGFDFNAISKAMASNQHSHRVRGASTITQQTAKNLFLMPSRSWWRKGLEAYMTVWLELLLSKQRILETYLNVAQFGDGIFGVEAAARYYFHKPASQLDAREAATLAASLPNPLLFKPNRPSAYMLKRRNWILEQMKRLGPNVLG